MRVFASLVAALCMIGTTMPAHAIGMQFCDDIKDAQARMACLQQHISHLEETIVALGGKVATLENALQNVLEADASYKLKSVAQGKCLGLGGDNKDELTLVTCDTPDSWSVLKGAPIKKPAKTAAPAAEAGTNAAATTAAPTDTSTPASNGSNPCKNLDQAACTAKTDSCEWRADKNRCGRKSG
jgi:hypothetical protein